MEVPPGTQPGDVLVLAKKGAPKLNKPSIRGDHLFSVKVTIPKRIRWEHYLFQSPYVFLYKKLKIVMVIIDLRVGLFMLSLINNDNLVNHHVTHPLLQRSLLEINSVRLDITNVVHTKPQTCNLKH